MCDGRMRERQPQQSRIEESVAETGLKFGKVGHFNWNWETSNTEHRTSNTQSMERAVIGCSVLNVGCSMFPFSIRRFSRRLRDRRLRLRRRRIKTVFEQCGDVVLHLF